MTDPAISLHALSAELGVSITCLRKWVRAGFIPRTAHGTTTLLTALAGIIRAVRAEAAETAPYMAKAPKRPAGAIPLDAADDLMSLIAARFDTALRAAIKDVEAQVVDLPLSDRLAIREAEAVRKGLSAARHRVVELPANAQSLIRGWEANR